jgi:hypothetical protein
MPRISKSIALYHEKRGRPPWTVAFGTKLAGDPAWQPAPTHALWLSHINVIIYCICILSIATSKVACTVPCSFQHEVSMCVSVPVMLLSHTRFQHDGNECMHDYATHPADVYACTYNNKICSHDAKFWHLPWHCHDSQHQSFCTQHK